MNTPAYSRYQDENGQHREPQNPTPPFGLPLTVEFDKKYLWLENPGCYVELGEAQFLIANPDVAEIYDALEAETVYLHLCEQTPQTDYDWVKDDANAHALLSELLNAWDQASERGRPDCYGEFGHAVEGDLIDRIRALLSRPPL